MDPAIAQALADGYAAYTTVGDLSVLRMFSPDFYDNVSLVTHTDDTVVMWYTVRGRHIGNGFPRLNGLPIRGNIITWPQVHIFRLADDLVVEHWAVRDDAALLDSVVA